jgi:hypothetical protein
MGIVGYQILRSIRDVFPLKLFALAAKALDDPVDKSAVSAACGSHHSVGHDLERLLRLQTFKPGSWTYRSHYPIDRTHADRFRNIAV